MFVVYYCLLITSLFAALLLLARQFLSGCRPAWLVLAVLFYFLYNLVLTSALAVAFLRIGNWNWSGKTICVGLNSCLLPALRLSRDEIGLRLPRTRGEWLAAAIGICVMPLLSAAERALDAPHSYDLESVAFQASLPGLDEELVYRGILLSLLLRGFNASRSSGKEMFLAAGVVTMLFWLAHAVFLSHGEIRYDFNKPEVVLAGILFVWLRIGSGSIIVSTIAHNLDNVANVVVGGII